MLSTLRHCARPVAARTFFRAAPLVLRNGQRAFSAASAAAQKLKDGLKSELEFEKKNYEKPAELECPKGWTQVETAGEVNMKIEKDIGDDRHCKVEWQLVTPYNAEDDFGQNPEEEPEPNFEEVDFTITVEKKDGTNGLTLFCSTQQAEADPEAPEEENAPKKDGARFIIGNVKVWSSTAEKENPAAYNGPEFEDLEDSLQEALDEYLGEIGVGDAVFDFIDASAVDKEHREYMRWLEAFSGFVKN